MAFRTAFNPQGIDSYKLLIVSMGISFHALRVAFYKSSDDVILNWDTFVFRMDHIFSMALMSGDCGGQSLRRQIFLSSSTLKFLDKRKVCLLSDCPTQSPDLNIIENMWAEFKKRIRKHHPTPKADLWEVIQKQRYRSPMIT